MKARIKRTLAAGANAFGVLRASRALRPGRSFALMFHRVVRDEAPGDGANASLTVSERAFRDMMEHIAAHELCAPLEELVAPIASGAPPQRGRIAITFDDGYLDNFEVAFPILKELGLPATIFAATDCLDDPSRRLWWDEAAAYFEGRDALAADIAALMPGISAGTPPPARGPQRREWVSNFIRRDMRHLAPSTRDAVVRAMRAENADGARRIMLDWDQARAMRDSGLVSIAPHTASHPILTQLTLDEAAIEVAASMGRISEEMGSCPKIFAYPGGAVPGYYAELARRCGLRSAVTTRRNRLGKQTDPLLIPRVDARYLLLEEAFEPDYFRMATSFPFNAVMEAAHA